MNDLNQDHKADSGLEANPAQLPETEEKAPATDSLSLVEQILGVIISPYETMADLARKPRILFPIIAMALTMPALYLIRYDMFKSFMIETMEASMAQQGVMMPAEQISAMMEWIPMVSIASTPFSVLIGWLFMTGVFFGLAKTMKGRGTFKQYLSVTGYAYVVTVLYCLISLVMSFFTGEITMNTSLGLFFADLQGSYVYGLLRSIDLFNIWYYVLMAIGVGIVSEISRPRIYGAVAAVYLITVLVGGYSAQYL